MNTVKIRIVECIVKDGNNYIKKYTSKSCRTEKLKVSSGGFGYFGDKSWSINCRDNIGKQK